MTREEDLAEAILLDRLTAMKDRAGAVLGQLDAIKRLAADLPAVVAESADAEALAEAVEDASAAMARMKATDATPLTPEGLAELGAILWVAVSTCRATGWRTGVVFATAEGLRNDRLAMPLPATQKAYEARDAMTGAAVAFAIDQAWVARLVTNHEISRQTSTEAERVKRWRERRKLGLTPVQIDLHASEVEVLRSLGLVRSRKPSQDEIREAVQTWLMLSLSDHTPADRDQAEQDRKGAGHTLLAQARNDGLKLWPAFALVDKIRARIAPSRAGKPLK